ncbi:MAG: SDR family NAD(P)-dependent oxidoreductase [Acetivibrionales bacterium]|jgi:2-deoxy-D-gluconate 3-dehydrogenase
MDRFRIDGKIAVITGGAGGIGEVICQELARAGAYIVLADYNEERGNAIVDDLNKAGFQAEFSILDVTSSAQVKALFKKVASDHGKVDILVNCAGVTRRMDSLEFDEEAFDRIMAVNVKGVFLCCKYAAQSMVKQNGGKIVNMASIGGVRALRNTMGYCTSKGAVVQMTRAFAMDWAKYKINVNAVGPALNNTPIAAPVMEDKEMYQYFLNHIPLGRLCEPIDVACAVRYLASPAADFVTGQILMVDGGWSID